MNKLSVLIIVQLFLMSVFALGQNGKKLPSVVLKTEDNKTFNSSNFLQNDGPVLICLWETTCKPSVDLLDVLSENYDDWYETIRFKIVAVSVEDTRTSAKAPLFANGREWDFEIFLDVNQDFKRALNASICPNIYLLDTNGNIVWEKTSYVPGDENLILQQLKELKK